MSASQGGNLPRHREVVRAKRALAHELRNPLSAIYLVVTSLLESPDDSSIGEARRALELARSSAENMMQLVDDFSGEALTGVDSDGGGLGYD